MSTGHSGVQWIGCTPQLNSVFSTVYLFKTEETVAIS